MLRQKRCGSGKRLGSLFPHERRLFSLCALQGIEVILIHQGERPASEQELAKDVLEIMTVFSARLYGAGSHKHKRLMDRLATDDVVAAAKELSAL